MNNKNLNLPYQRKVFILLALISMAFNFKVEAQCNGVNTFTDARDGRIYNQITVGTQCWMAENLDFGTYVAVATSGQNPAGVQKYCSDLSGNNDPTCPMGGLYEWAEIMAGSSSCNGSGAPPNDVCPTPVQGICPAGWHIPSRYEWTTLERNVGSSTPATFPYDLTTIAFLGTDEGGNMKVIPICGTLPCWNSANTGATNNSGFNGLPAGTSFSGSFNSTGDNGYWWSSTEFDASEGWHQQLNRSRAGIARSRNNKLSGFSVRCIWDNAAWPLPIELLYFDANWTDNSYETVTLNWETISESENSHFEIERSIDAINFEYVKSVDGSGTSNQNIQYSTLDEDPYTDGISYYRLKQVDNNGDFEYSNIEALNIPEGLSIINLYPNPTVNELTVLLTSSEETETTIHIKNNIGQVIRTLEQQIEKGYNTITFDFSTLSTGNYVIEITTVSGLYSVEQKFIKAKQ